MLPRIDSSLLLKGIDASPDEIKEVGFSELFLDIASYITFYPDPEYDIIRPSVNITTLSKTQAFLLIHQLHEDLKLTGAIHLTQLDMILIQDNENNYMLKYGDNPAFESLPPFTLDMTNGFNYTGSRFALIDIILKELNIFFKQWKENNFQEKLFPDNQMLAFEKKTLNNAVNAGQSSIKFFNLNQPNKQIQDEAIEEMQNFSLQY